MVKNTTTEVEVKGRVDTVSGSMLSINQLNVDFTGAVTPDGTPTVGKFVEVKGTVFSCGVSTDSLTATSVELEPEAAGVIPTGIHVEVEGFISEMTPDGFKIGSQEVVITSITRFLPEGFSNTDIMEGAKVEAEGTSVNGVINATKISFRENVRLESDVASVTSNSFELVGFPGIIITTNSTTEPFGVTVTQGDHIRVRGIEGPNNTVLATRIDDRYHGGCQS